MRFTFIFAIIVLKLEYIFPTCALLADIYLGTI